MVETEIWREIENTSSSRSMVKFSGPRFLQNEQHSLTIVINTRVLITRSTGSIVIVNAIRHPRVSTLYKIPSPCYHEL
jgi:hypothetical protein